MRSEVRWGVLVLLLLGMVLGPVRPAVANCPTQLFQPVTRLSDYWPEVVRQWEPIILEEAQRRGVDPDLIASVIWKESRGNPRARGPVGAVGLMMVMPSDAGFTWRPTAQELYVPETNLFWGVRALSTVLRDADGDLYAALAAYNGGWEQIQYRGPRRFASDIIDEYARAVAVRHGLSSASHWVATVAPMCGPGSMTVVGPQRSLVRYSRPPVIANFPTFTTRGLPTAVVFSPLDGRDLSSRVGVWILMDEEVVRGESPEGSASPAPPDARLPSLDILEVLSHHSYLQC